MNGEIRVIVKGNRKLRCIHLMVTNGNRLNMEIQNC